MRLPGNVMAPRSRYGEMPTNSASACQTQYAAMPPMINLQLTSNCACQLAKQIFCLRETLNGGITAGLARFPPITGTRPKIYAATFRRALPAPAIAEMFEQLDAYTRNKEQTGGVPAPKLDS